MTDQPQDDRPADSGLPGSASGVPYSSPADRAPDSAGTTPPPVGYQAPPPPYGYGEQAPGYGQQSPAQQSPGYGQSPMPQDRPGWVPSAPVPLSPSDERLWAMLSHLAPFVGAFVGLPFLGPLVVFLIYRERSAFVRSQSLESLNFQITLMIGYVISVILIFLIIGIPMIILIGLGSVVFQIIAAVAANRGEDYRYPLTLRLVK